MKGAKYFYGFSAKGVGFGVNFFPRPGHLHRSQGRALFRHHTSSRTLTRRRKFKVTAQLSRRNGCHHRKTKRPVAVFIALPPIDYSTHIHCRSGTPTTARGARTGRLARSFGLSVTSGTKEEDDSRKEAETNGAQVAAARLKYSSVRDLRRVETGAHLLQA